MSMDMFEEQEEKQTEEQQLQQAPLATRMRPNNLGSFVGQEHILAKGRVLRKLIESDRVPSMIFWGPPGCGKTTLAFIIANSTGAHFDPVSAVSASVADLGVLSSRPEREARYRCSGPSSSSMKSTVLIRPSRTPCYRSSRTAR